MENAKTITSKPDKVKKDKDGSEIIDLTKKVNVTMTDKAPHHAEGEVTAVHPKIAELFVKRGFGKLGSVLKSAKKAAASEGEEGDDENED